MFQPRVKLEFVRRYCNPGSGWEVYVDIDASEEGRTGGERKSADADKRREEMLAESVFVRREFKSIGVTAGGGRKEWSMSRHLPYVAGDSDIVGYHRASKRCLVAEVEGESSGQPEQKLYKAVGQIVRAVSNPLTEWNAHFVIVVYGDKIATHLSRITALEKLSIAALALAADRKDDNWLFGDAMVG